MPNRFLTHAVRASLLALVAATVGCDGPSPSGPTPPSPTPSSGPASPPAVAAPVVSSIAPNVGNSTGGTMIHINGSGFQVGAKVTLDGAETPTYPVDSPAVIRLPVPPHRTGSVDVAVINPDGQSARLIGGFSYEDSERPVSTGPRPSISSVSPSAGISGGGTYVYIKGTAFQSGATVTLGGAGSDQMSSVIP